MALKVIHLFIGQVVQTSPKSTIEDNSLHITNMKIDIDFMQHNSAPSSTVSRPQVQKVLPQVNGTRMALNPPSCRSLSVRISSDNSLNDPFVVSDSSQKNEIKCTALPPTVDDEQKNCDSILGSSLFTRDVQPPVNTTDVSLLNTTCGNSGSNYSFDMPTLNKRLKELEKKVEEIPLLQSKITLLKEEKRSLQYILCSQNKSDFRSVEIGENISNDGESVSKQGLSDKAAISISQNSQCPISKFTLEHKNDCGTTPNYLSRIVSDKRDFEPEVRYESIPIEGSNFSSAQVGVFEVMQDFGITQKVPLSGNVDSADDVYEQYIVEEFTDRENVLPRTTDYQNFYCEEASSKLEDWARKTLPVKNGLKNTKFPIPSVPQQAQQLLNPNVARDKFIGTQTRQCSGAAPSCCLGNLVTCDTLFQTDKHLLEVVNCDENSEVNESRKFRSYTFPRISTLRQQNPSSGQFKNKTEPLFASQQESNEKSSNDKYTVSFKPENINETQNAIPLKKTFENTLSSDSEKTSKVSRCRKEVIVRPTPGTSIIESNGQPQKIVQKKETFLPEMVKTGVKVDNNLKLTQASKIGSASSKAIHIDKDHQEFCADLEIAIGDNESLSSFCKESEKACDKFRHDEKQSQKSVMFCKSPSPCAVPYQCVQDTMFVKLCETCYGHLRTVMADVNQSPIMHPETKENNRELVYTPQIIQSEESTTIGTNSQVFRVSDESATSSTPPNSFMQSPSAFFAELVHEATHKERDYSITSKTGEHDKGNKKGDKNDSSIPFERKSPQTQTITGDTRKHETKTLPLPGKKTVPKKLGSIPRPSNIVSKKSENCYSKPRISHRSIADNLALRKKDTVQRQISKVSPTRSKIITKGSSNQKEPIRTTDAVSKNISSVVSKVKTKDGHPVEEKNNVPSVKECLGVKSQALQSRRLMARQTVTPVREQLLNVDIETSDQGRHITDSLSAKSTECVEDECSDSGKETEDENIFSSEFRKACKIVNDYLLDLEKERDESLKTPVTIVQGKWFDAAGSKRSKAYVVRRYLNYFKELSEEMVKWIVNSVGPNGNNVVHFALANNSFDVVAELLDTGLCDLNRFNKVGYTTANICSVCKPETEDDRQVVLRLLRLGNVNFRSLRCGQTALMMAVSYGNVEVVRLLLLSGADINIQDDEGSTALMCAAENGNVDCTKQLLEQPDCDPTITDSNGLNACSIALEAGHTDVGLLIYFRVVGDRGYSQNSPVRYQKWPNKSSRSPRNRRSPNLPYSRKSG